MKENGIRLTCLGNNGDTDVLEIPTFAAQGTLALEGVRRLCDLGRTPQCLIWSEKGLPENCQLGKVIAEVTTIPCQQAVGMKHRVSADEEIGRDPARPATA